MESQNGRRVCYCRVHGTMAVQTTPQHTSTERRHHHTNHNPQQHQHHHQQQHQQRIPPAVPPHQNIHFNFDTQWVNCQPDLLYPQLQNFAFATSTIDHGALVRQRRQHRQKTSTEDILEQYQQHQQQQQQLQQQQQPQQQHRVQHSHNSSHHHHPHHHHHERDNSHRQRHKGRHVASSASHQKRHEYKSAPSSPVSHHRSRLDHSSQLLLLQESEKPMNCVTAVTGVTNCIEQSDKFAKPSTTTKSRDQNYKITFSCNWTPLFLCNWTD